MEKAPIALKKNQPEKQVEEPGCWPEHNPCNPQGFGVSELVFKWQPLRVAILIHLEGDVPFYADSSGDGVSEASVPR